MSTSANKREGDPEELDPSQLRHWRGTPLPSDFVNGELVAGWGDKALTLKGPMVILVVLLGLLGAITFYFHDSQQRAHANVLRATNMAICVSLYDFEERKQLRKSWSMDPKGAPQQWCPNVGAGGD